MSSEGAIKHFKTFLHDSDIPHIDVSRTENQALYPFYEHVGFSFAQHWSGVLIIDKQGVYTPIEKYNNNVIHLLRLPKLNVPVYAMTDLRSIVYTEYKDQGRRTDLTIVFQGVYKTVTGCYDFISNEYFIRPVPGISFEKNLIVQHVVKRGKIEVAVIDDSDDYYDEDDGLD